MRSEAVIKWSERTIFRRATGGGRIVMMLLCPAQGTHWMKQFIVDILKTSVLQLASGQIHGVLLSTQTPA